MYKDRLKQWGVIKNTKQKEGQKRRPRRSKTPPYRDGELVLLPPPAKVLRTSSNTYVPELTYFLVREYVKSPNQLPEFCPERNRDWWELLTLGVGLVEANMCEQGFRLLNLCLDHWSLRIRRPGPELLLDTYMALAYLEQTRFPDIARLFTRYIADLVSVVLPFNHPLRWLWSTPTHRSQMGNKDFTKALAELILDTCDDQITNQRTFSTFSNTLLCLDHMQTTGLMSDYSYSRRYSQHIKNAFPGNQLKHQLLRNLLGIKQTLERGDFKASDHYLDEAVNCLGCPTDISSLIEALLPCAKAYDAELSREIGELQNTSHDPRGPGGVPAPSAADGDIWASYRRPTELLGSKTTHVFEVHYMELVKRSADLKRQYCANKQVTIPLSDPRPSAHQPRLACRGISKSGTESPTTANPKMNEPKKGNNAVLEEDQRFINKRALLSWLWQWLFVGSVRTALRDDPIPAEESGPDSPMSVNKWIMAHFFNIDWQNAPVPDIPMKYFDLTVTHHVGGGSRQIFR